MSKSDKLPEIRKEAFIRAREALGLTVKDVSGMSCFSIRQIEQIENGEISSFYGAQNKVTAAKKIAELLKMNQEEAFDFGVSAIAVHKPQKNENLDSEVATSQDFVPEKNLKPPMMEEAKKVETQPAKGLAVELESSKSPKQVNPKKKLIILLGVCAALVFSVVNLRPLFFPEPVKEEVVIVEQVVQAPEPDPKVEPTPPTSVAQAPGPLSPSPAAIAAADCPVADSSAMNYKPDAPKKAGDNVYLQSKTAQTVCVVDATGKTQIKLLEPGVGTSVYGKPPFKVLTGGLNQVDLYYQGAKVRLGNTTGKTINLEPAEIIQPAAPLPSSDSQLR